MFLLTKMLNFGLMGTVRPLHGACQWGFPPAWNCDGRIHVTFLNSIFNYGRPPSSCLQWALITVWQLEQMMKACPEMIEAYSSFALLCCKTGPAHLNSIISVLINWHNISHTHRHTHTSYSKHLMHHIPATFRLFKNGFNLITGTKMLLDTNEAHILETKYTLFILSLPVTMQNINTVHYDFSHIQK